MASFGVTTIKKVFLYKFKFHIIHLITGSFIVFVFKNELKVKSIRLLSGGENHPQDIMPPNSEISLAKTGVKFPARNIFPDEYFHTVGLVGADGQFEKTINEAHDLTDKTHALKIKISSETAYWIWIYNIYIETFAD